MPGDATFRNGKPIEKDIKKPVRQSWDGGEFLSELASLSFDNPNKLEIMRLICDLLKLEKSKKRQIFGDDHEQFAIRWKERIEERGAENDPLVKTLREKVEGSTVVDLGGGITRDSNGYRPSIMQSVAEKLGARVYVNVDRFLIPDADPMLIYDIAKKLGIEPKADSSMQVAYTNTDLLFFLSLLESEKGGIVISINGIDDIIVNDTYLKYQRLKTYHQWLAEEIVRVLPKDSVVLCIESEAAKYFEELGLKLVEHVLGAHSLDGVWLKE